MAETFPFTKQRLQDLAPSPSGKRLEVRDADVPGLILQVTPTGVKTFYYYAWTKGKAKRHLIGRFPALTIPQARQRAKELTGLVATGQDPTEVQRAGWTFADLFEWWWRVHGQHLRTAKELRGKYDRYLAEWAPRKASEITRADVRALHASFGAAHAANGNRLLALVRGIYNRAIEEDVFTGPNPAAHIRGHREEARERRLSLAEAHRLLTALVTTDSQQLRDYVLLSLYTGARRGNVVAMRWDELNLDDDQPTWRIPRTKNGRPQTLPLLADEVEILKRRRAGATGPWVFPGRKDKRKEGDDPGHMRDPKKGWKSLCERAKITGLRIHDLRRSLASFMIDEGVSLAVIGKTLGHQSPAATAIYARLSLEPVKEAKAKALAAIQLKPEA